MALVLCAVFVPCAFISGITGRFFRQFAVTIAVSTVFSAFNSLTLSPALAAILLRPHGGRPRPADLAAGHCSSAGSSGCSTGCSTPATAGYAWMVGRLLRGSLIVLLVYGGPAGPDLLGLHQAPTGFVPQQDQGRLIVNIQLPDSASLQRTQEAMAADRDDRPRDPGVAHTIAISGMSFVLQANSSNFGSMFVILDPFEKRRTPDLTRHCHHGPAAAGSGPRQIKDAQVTCFGRRRSRA